MKTVDYLLIRMADYDDADEARIIGARNGHKLPDSLGCGIGYMRKAEYVIDTYEDPEKVCEDLRQTGAQVIYELLSKDEFFDLMNEKLGFIFENPEVIDLVNAQP